MEPVMERLDIHSDFDAFVDYFERFEVRVMAKEDAEDVYIVAHFLRFIGKEAYSLLRTLAMPEKPISLPYTILKDLLLDYVRYTNSEYGEGGRFRKMIHGDTKNSTTLRHPNPMHTQGYADNSWRSCDTVHEDGHKFGQCLSCDRFHSFNSCKFRNSMSFKCGDIGHIQSVCNTTVHLAATNIKSCNSDSIKLSIYNDHLFSSTISKDSVQSYGSSELSEIHNLCETTVSNQSTYQISHVAVPDMVFSNDSLISDEISCKYEENMLNEPSHDRKSDVVLTDDDFSNHPLLCNDSLNKFEETISEESNLIVIPNITCPHSAFVSCEKLVQYEAQVLNELDFDYNSDDFISTAIYPYHKNTSNVFSNQREEYVLNEVTSFITWGYTDPTLFRVGG
ncbi:unnamed protein product [Schistosoma margrebowiei]|uniref:Uncharacterized protein n=1 Tax=Schistosoma margrebowiei TaxID=48269 RepID=A0A183MQR1_9TREM|nr:unnamed protein product [Schistosoma margrebowiei]